MKFSFISPNWPAPKNIRALTTLRNATTDYINTLPVVPKWLKQVHGTAVICVEESNIELPEADAAVSFVPHQACVVRTADCLPILLCDINGTQVAAIHAGWRGLSAGIIARTCEQLPALASKLLVWLGPAIGPAMFEVGTEVRDNFLQHGWGLRQINMAFKPVFVAGEQKYLADLYCLASLNLQDQGILSEHIFGGQYCTYSDPQRFYSYRRSKDTGRMSSLIWLE